MCHVVILNYCSTPMGPLIISNMNRRQALERDKSVMHFTLGIKVITHEVNSIKAKVNPKEIYT